MSSRRFQLKYNTVTDADIIKRLEAQESIQGYIRRLILSDIMADSLQGVFKVIHEDRKKIDLHDPCKHCEYEDEDAKYCIQSKCPHFDMTNINGGR